MDLPVSNLLIDIGSLFVLALGIIGIVYKLDKGALHHFYFWNIFSKGRLKKIFQTNRQHPPKFLYSITA